MIDYKTFQNFVITGYRLLMMTILIAIVVGVLSYLIMIIFYAINKNWAIPVTLSPTQEKVLAFQSQAATLEATLLKNKVDLATATEKYIALNKEITNIESLIDKFNAASQYESKELAKTETSINDVLQTKRINTRDTEKAARDAQPLLASINQELAAGLITKDEAISRRMSIQSVLNAATDSRINQITLQEQERLASTASGTLGKQDATSLTALQSLNNEAQLKFIHAQAIVDKETAKQSIEQLRITVAESERVLEVAKHSPYYMALTKPVSVAFVQYGNLHNAKPGAPVYDCLLQIILCRKVGTVIENYDAEEYATHPLFRTDLKGKFVGINFNIKKSSESYVVFLGYKPLLL
ncbi:MAG: hypothetical protein LBU72_07045 [Burkholderiaceae bacterium]|jgi:hypothetical protein|nr:hypothetical protein [Burkholderiaceae bacterium]